MARPGERRVPPRRSLNFTCLALALVVLHATRRGERPAWLAMATAIGDVTLVSFLHYLDVAQGHPAAAVNGRVTFLGYFLALVGTCIRWDRRVPLLAGAVAAVQYGALVAWGASRWPATPTADVLQYGQFDWGSRWSGWSRCSSSRGCAPGSRSGRCACATTPPPTPSPGS
ncbi:MAG: hypothetical protein IPF77_10975 [Gemmatimonadetes bacterium]|nr:hypothetical protein [Gemmatimonadota bacterium]